MPEPAPNRRMSVLGLISAACALAGVATGIAFLGWFHWLPELFTHFRVQYAVALIGGAVILGVARHARSAAVFSSLAAANFVFIAAAGLGHARREPSAPPALTVLSINVLTSNAEHERVLSLIRESAADVVVLTEVDDDWAAALRPLRDGWPYGIIEPREDNFGIALLSRLPLRDSQLIELADSDVPAVRTTIRAGDADVVLYGVHLLPPSSAGYAHLRDGQTLALARRVRQWAEPVIVVGDFNATPWSPVWRRFAADSGLRPVVAAYGLRGTWPNGFPLLSIPLDHVFVSDPLRIVNHEIGPDIGSDHRPVIVTIAVP